MNFFENQKDLEKEGKLTEKDVGFGEDSFEALKQACGDEAHCLGNFIAHPTTATLQALNKARQRRTTLLELIIISVGAKITDQQWCRLKHIGTEAMHVQELIARHSTQNNLQLAIKFGNLHKELYLEYLTILGFTEKNIKSITSA